VNNSLDSVLCSADQRRYRTLQSSPRRPATVIFMDWSTVCLFIDYTTADYIIQTTFTTVENINLITMLISTQLTELPPKWLALHIRESSWKYQTYWKMEKLLNPLSREWHLCHVPKPIFCLMLPWPLTSWVLTPTVDCFTPLLYWPLVPICIRICFQVPCSPVTDKSIVQMARKHIATACHSGLQ